MRARKRILIIIIMAFLICSLMGIVEADPEETTYYFGDEYRHKVELDNGYSKPYLSIDKDDPHYGWSLGEFKLTGWTQKSFEGDKLVFLKNAGDTVRLSFVLQQRIKELNDNKDLYISEDKDGYDKYFGINQTNFGRGMLIIRYTDYQNHTYEPQKYADYLAGVEVGADTVVDFFEEGDYEVCLDYEIGRDRAIKDKYYNYEIFFRFSVRNGNCMFFPRDLKTGAELSDKSITASGFLLDLAKTRYLDITIKKEILVDGAVGVTEDTRFNKPAKDGERFTDDGIYTITAKNKYTTATTTKTIYVGENNIAKAYVVTGKSIEEINQMLAQGYTIADDGTFINPPKPTATPSPAPTEMPMATPTVTEEPVVTPTAVITEVPSSVSGENVTREKTSDDDSIKIVAIVSSAVAFVILAIIFFAFRKRKTNEAPKGQEYGALLGDNEKPVTTETSAEAETTENKEG